MIRGMTALVILLATTAMAQSIDEVFASIDEKTEAVTSTRATITTKVSMNYPGYVSETLTVSRQEAEEVGEHVRSRMEMTSSGKTTMGEQTTTTDSKTLMVMDGTYMWTQTEENGQVTVVKSKPVNTRKLKPSSMMAPLRATHELKVLPEEEVGGQSCYVIEARMKAMEGMPPQGRMVFCFSKEIGMMLRNVAYDAEGKETSRTEVSDLETGIDIDDSRFVYTPPEGVQVLDQTQEGGSGGN